MPSIAPNFCSDSFFSSFLLLPSLCLSLRISCSTMSRSGRDQAQGYHMRRTQGAPLVSHQRGLRREEESKAPAVTTGLWGQRREAHPSVYNRQFRFVLSGLYTTPPPWWLYTTLFERALVPLLFLTRHGYWLRGLCCDGACVHPVLAPKASCHGTSDMSAHLLGCPAASTASSYSVLLDLRSCW